MDRIPMDVLVLFTVFAFVVVICLYKRCRQRKSQGNHLGRSMKVSDSTRGMLKTCNAESIVVFEPNKNYSSFRIPAIVYHDNGVFCFCEGREKGSADEGPMNIVMKHGVVHENGSEVNWGDVQVVARPSDKKFRVMNPCPVVFRSGKGKESTDAGLDLKIVLVYIEFPVNESVKQLIVGKRYNQKVWCITGYKNGKTQPLQWSDPEEITHILDHMDPKPLLFVTGPGHGIQLSAGSHDGRLIISAYTQYKKSSARSSMDKLLPFRNTVCQNCLIYSDDGGSSWDVGATVVSAKDKHGHHLHSNECQVAEVSPDELYINSRSKEPGQNRQSAFSTDGGDSFSRVEIDDIVEPSGLPIPRQVVDHIPDWLTCLFYGSGCEGSIVSVDSSSSTRQLIFCNPADKSKRKNLSLRVSKDGGESWSEPHTLCPGPSAYSDMATFTSEDGNTQYVVCLYESSAKIVLDFVDIDNIGLYSLADEADNIMETKAWSE